MIRNALLLLILIGLPYSVRCQENISSFFKLVFYEVDNEMGFYATPDSLRNNPYLKDFAANMFGYNVFLYTNYSVAEERFDSLYQLLPDTGAVISEHKKLLEEDEYFKNLFYTTLYKREIPPIHIDEIINIVSKFYYVYEIDGKIAWQLCAGINGLYELDPTEYSPFYSSFSFLVVYNESALKKFNSIANSYKGSFNENIDSKRLNEIKKEVYSKIKKDPEIQQLVIDAYNLNKDYLNFELMF